MCAPKVSWHAVICGFLIINRKIYQQKKTADWKWIFMCVFWVYSPAGWRHPHPPPDLTRNTLCMHLHVHRKPLAQQLRPGDTDLSPVPAPGALCRFSRPNNTNQIFFQQANTPPSILHTLFHLNSGEKKKAQ